MPLPKSLLCILGDHDFDAERQLRAAGFATAMIQWKELSAQPGTWMELAEILEDTAVKNFVVVGDGTKFDRDVLAKLSLFKLSLQREDSPVLALVSPEADSIELPPILSDTYICKPGTPLGAKLMARRFQPNIRQSYSSPFFLKAHLDNLIGLWLEIAPSYGTWPGFMLGVTGADISAFGTGTRGVIPKKSILSYPMLGIKGNINDENFSACAAKNELSEAESCFLRISGIPTGVFVAEYPDDDSMLKSRFPILKFTW